MRIPVLISFLIFSIAVSAQNTCEEAIPVEVGLYTVDSVAGVLDETSCFAFNNNVEFAEWYSYTAVEDIYLRITSDLEQNSGGDTRLNVLTGTCGDLTCLDGDDDGGDIGNGYLSDIEVFVAGGTTVYLAWDDRWNNDGFDFEISEAEFVEPALGFTGVSVSGTGNRLGVVDMNGDNLDDIVGVSFNDSQIQISYQEEDGSLTYMEVPTEEPENYPSWSMAAGDFDANGYNDLIFGGGSGVSFMYANEDGTEYTQVSGEEYVFSQRSNCIDIDNDGNLDAFVCHDVQPNVYYMNDGEGNLGFIQGGLGETANGGNYGSIWVDYDTDGDTDLFIAKCRGGNSPAKINQLHRNNGDGTFDEISSSLTLNDPVQTWSSAWGDYDNDGDLDIFIGASSFADGGHKLLRNDGGTFVNVTNGSGLDNITGTGIENVCHDFDNDGFIDILGMGNTFMHNNGDMTFTEWDVEPGNGPIGDMNNDGFLDILSGQLYINDGNDNNYIKIVTQGVESNINGIGAMITVYTPTGDFMRQVRSGDGFRYMSSLTAHFGLGQETTIDSIKVVWPSGIIDLLPTQESNTLLVIVEGEHEVIVTSTDDAEELDFMVYPNPAVDQILIDFPTAHQSVTYTVYDVSGKLVLQSSLRGNSIDVSGLTPGAYVLQLVVDGKQVEKKIIKE